MDDDKLLEWMASSSTGFALGVMILVLGSKSVLSEKNLREKFSGVKWLFGWVGRRRQRQADLEVEAAVELQHLCREQHRYILWVTRLVRSWEVWAARHGHQLPPPPFLSIDEWRKQKHTED